MIVSIGVLTLPFLLLFLTGLKISEEGVRILDDYIRREETTAGSGQSTALFY